MGSIQPGGGAVGSGSREHGLTKGWLAAFGTAGYDDEPPLLEELGVNFGHIKMKVRFRPDNSTARTQKGGLLTKQGRRLL